METQRHEKGRLAPVVGHATVEAEALRLRADGEAEGICATGTAKAEVYRAGVESLGSQTYTVMQLMQFVGDRNVRLVPDVAVTGTSANPGIVDGLLGLMLRKQGNRQEKRGVRRSDRQRIECGPKRALHFATEGRRPAFSGAFLLISCFRSIQYPAPGARHP